MLLVSVVFSMEINRKHYFQSILHAKYVFHCRYVPMEYILETMQELLDQAEVYLENYSHRLEGWIAIRRVKEVHIFEFWFRQGSGEQHMSLNCDIPGYQHVPKFSNLCAECVKYIEQ